MRALRVIPRGHVVVQRGKIVAVGEGARAASGARAAGTSGVAGTAGTAGPAGTARPDAIIDGRGRVLLPALVDCHTHACWVGERWQEWELKRSGVPYLEILRQGGGIMSSVRAVRAASVDALAGALADHLDIMRACGTGAVEVKTGYGLTAEAELAMLDAILKVRAVWPAPVVPTLLAGHAIDADNPDQLQHMLDLLPIAAARAPGIAVDAFCENGAWSVEQCRVLLTRARDLALPVRLHTDQFTALGGLDLALSLGARSVDHLEATTPAGMRALAASATIGVALPACAFALGEPYADARSLIDLGGAIALASNWNPGSAPSPSAAFAGALACRHMRMNPAEAITALTWNAACVLGLQRECGAIAPGYRGDLILLPERDERALVYSVADAGPDVSMLGTDLAVRRA